MTKQRTIASLLILGSGFLLYRTLFLLSQGALEIQVWWVSVLLFVEMLIDFTCLMSSVRWFITNDRNGAALPLQLTAAVIIIHALRVLIFVLGRTGPWINFDVLPEHRALHATRWTWEGVYLAAILAGLSVIGLIIFWRLRARKKRKSNNTKKVG
jgi:signal transduction histidine kinase